MVVNNTTRINCCLLTWMGERCILQVLQEVGGFLIPLTSFFLLFRRNQTRTLARTYSLFMTESWFVFPPILILSNSNFFFVTHTQTHLMEVWPFTSATFEHLSLTVSAQNSLPRSKIVRQEDKHPAETFLTDLTFDMSFDKWVNYADSGTIWRIKRRLFDSDTFSFVSGV